MESDMASLAFLSFSMLSASPSSCSCTDELLAFICPNTLAVLAVESFSPLIPSIILLITRTTSVIVFEKLLIISVMCSVASLVWLAM